MSKIACYVTGHGFGHVVRVLELCRNLPEDWEIHLKTTAPKWLIDIIIQRNCFCYPERTDSGSIQKDCFQLDMEQTLVEAAKLHKEWPLMLKKETDWIKSNDIDVILSDIPPLPFLAADKCRIPSVGLTNFSWDWIYGEYVEHFPEYKYLIEEFLSTYSKSSLLLRLPFYGDLSAFPNIVDINHIARMGKDIRRYIYEDFGISSDCKLILISFGGLGLDSVDWKKLEELRDYHFFTYSPLPYEVENITYIEPSEILHPDMVKSVDAVVSKTGYGIVSECIENQTPLIFCERDYFREYHVLAKGLNEWDGGVFLKRNELLMGNWKEALDKASDLKGNISEIPCNGAIEGTKEITKLVNG